jgi:hypothetical protein
MCVLQSNVLSKTDTIVISIFVCNLQLFELNRMNLQKYQTLRLNWDVRFIQESLVIGVRFRHVSLYYKDTFVFTNVRGDNHIASTISH